MSSIDDLYDRVSKDYGRKNYLAGNDEAYTALMKKKTIFMYDAAFAQSWSEFEKPYLENSYEEMEQFLWNPPGIPWDPGGPGPGWDFPTIPSNPQDPGEPFGWPSLTVFWCQVSGCFCENDTREAMVNCSHPITGIGLAEPGARLAARDFSISAEIMGTSARLSITAGEDPGGAVEIDVTMQSAGGVNGSHGSLMISSCSDCEDCDAVDDVAWDDENNPDTADPGDSVLLQVLDGVPPFTWEIEQCGDEGENRCSIPLQTMSRMNFLKLGADACGPIVINVTDVCETETTGMIRCTNGRWSVCDTRNEIQGGGCSCSCSHIYHYFYWPENTLYLSEVVRYWARCNGACCGPGCAAYSCIVGPKTCNNLFVPCHDPCGNGNHTRTTDTHTGEVFGC